MFLKLGSLLDRTFGGRRSPTKPSFTFNHTKPSFGFGPIKHTKASSRARARTVSEPPVPATPPRASPLGPCAPAPQPYLDTVIDIRAAEPRAGARRVRFSSESTRASAGTDAPIPRPVLSSSPRKTAKAEAFPASLSTPDLSAPGRYNARERRPALRAQAAGRPFVAMAIVEEEDPWEGAPLTRSRAEREQTRRRPRPRTRPSTDSARAICGGVVGWGVRGPDDDDEDQLSTDGHAHAPVNGYAADRWDADPPAYTARAAPAGESFLSLDYSSDEDIDEDLHTTMFVHSQRAAPAARSSALLFTLRADSEGDDEREGGGWEAYGLEQTERKRERHRERRERRALLAAFPVPPPLPPTPAPHLGMLRHHAIAQWAKDSASVSVATACESAESSLSSLGRGSSSPSPLGWHASETSTADTTLELTPPRPGPGPRRAPYGARAPPAKSCPHLPLPGQGRIGKEKEKLLPLVPYDGLAEPIRFERHPYAAPALRAGRW
ncbi:hypothetical protein DAEQUDRAFT_134294 [Daedalea quercina L-15889]|uniref:Uncharacterized protein n=1 Tax=Daedalea quercina L-15889 TaxID=1314783 RepID=A0A165KP51_9APHY|nr:hypothetical protein DAEQUDRAFT_134294 [Daedalea quercina L-15889]